jgi:hypothetical protein
MAIAHYTAKRERFAKLYGKGSPAYRLRVVKINYKLKIWRKQVRAMEKREEKLKQLDISLAEFSGFRIKKGITSKIPRARKLLYKRLFARYAVESGCMGKEVSFYMGYVTGDRAAKLRKDFIRLANTDPTYKDTWERFKKYINH